MVVNCIISNVINKNFKYYTDKRKMYKKINVC